ncbi:hypothetical protein FACS1894190_17530 [Spirochaetia bacterium]|nr:hypothetical protein FACS1894190_17530 [Spirochaetia bacterium]
MKKKVFFVGFLGMMLALGMVLVGCDLEVCANSGKCSITYGGIGQGTSCGASKCAVKVGASYGTVGTTVKCSC